MDSLTNELAQALDMLQNAIRTNHNLSSWLYNADKVLRRYHDHVAEQEDKAKSTPIGICPACKQTVFQSDDAVWTCPRDLSENNPYWQPSDITEEQMEKDGVYSLCYEDHGGWCSDHMPLHGACYEKGNY